MPRHRLEHSSPSAKMLWRLAGLRPGEAAALRWRHYDATTAPLGKLTVALAYNTRKHRAKTTKTDAVRHVPVHPTLAGMLAEWRLSGWAAMMGRRPESDDLIVPLPPDAVARRRARTGDAFRSHDYSGKKWHEHDMPLLRSVLPKHRVGHGNECFDA
jgi:integrase